MYLRFSSCLPVCPSIPCHQFHTSPKVLFLYVFIHTPSPFIILFPFSVISFPVNIFPLSVNISFSVNIFPLSVISYSVKTIPLSLNTFPFLKTYLLVNTSSVSPALSPFKKPEVRPRWTGPSPPAGEGGFVRGGKGARGLIEATDGAALV